MRINTTNNQKGVNDIFNYKQLNLICLHRVQRLISSHKLSRINILIKSLFTKNAIFHQNEDKNGYPPTLIIIAETYPLKNFIDLADTNDPLHFIIIIHFKHGYPKRPLISSCRPIDSRISIKMRSQANAPIIRTPSRFLNPY